MTGYVLKMFPRFSETFILAEILELERRGHGVSIVSLKKPDDGRFHEDLARVKAQVSYLPEHFVCAPLVYAAAHLDEVSRRPGAWLRAMLLAIAHPRGAWKAFLRAPLVARSARAAGCARLHAHFASLPAVSAMLASILMGVPFTFTAHAKDIYIRGRSRRLLRTLIRRAERVVTVSDYNVRTLEELAGPALPPRRIVRIYNGVDLDAFRQETHERTTPGGSRAAAAGTIPVAGMAEPLESAGADADPVKPLILAVGRLVEKKGFEDLIEACAGLRDSGTPFRCEIVGKGPLQPALSRCIAEWRLDGHVRLVGPLPRREVAAKLGGAALLAVPCVIGKDGNRDGLPTVILEAMACGVPTVATEVTGIPEAVEDGLTGFVVRPSDPAAFGFAMRTLLEDPAMRLRMGRAARSRATCLFDLRKNVSSLEAIFSGWRPMEIPADRPAGAAIPAAMDAVMPSGRRPAAILVDSAVTQARSSCARRPDIL